MATGFTAKLVIPLPASKCVVLVANHHVLLTIEAALRCTVCFDRVAGEGQVEPGSHCLTQAPGRRVRWAGRG